MNILRKILISLLAALIGPFLLLAAYSFAVQRTVGNPEYIKHTLRDANIYEAIRNQLNTKAAEQQEPPKVVKDSLKKATKSGVVQGVVEQGIDNVFAFLNGDIPVDQVSIDVSPISSVFTKDIKAQLQQQIASLPKCAPGHAPNSYDPLEANCIVPGTNRQKVTDNAINQVLGEQDILSDDKLTLNDLQKLSSEGDTTGNVEQLQQDLQHVSTVYQISKWLAPASLLLAMLCSAGIIFMSRSKWQGVRRIGWIALANGVFILIASILVNFATHTFVPTPDGGVSNLETVGQTTIKTVISDIDHSVRVFGILMFIFGTATVIASSVMIKKRTKDTPKEGTPTEHTADKPVAKESKTEEDSVK